MEPLLFFHLLAIGIWVGCVATEVVIELSLAQRVPQQSGLAYLHAQIDRFVELPVIVVALFTGLCLLSGVNWDRLLMIKVLIGAAAVILNSVAAFTVQRRWDCLRLGDMEGYARFHRWHERVGIGCVVSLVGAIVAGGYHLLH